MSTPMTTPVRIQRSPAAATDPTREKPAGADISPDFKPDRLDAMILSRLIQHEATPRAIRIFSNEHHKLTDYGYWFGLSTLWVSYTGFSDLNLWKRLLSSPRPNRDTSLMKPSEVAVWRGLPAELLAYRAHRPGEIDWISYALDPQKAAEFAVRRGVDQVAEYAIHKSDAVCVFLRRGETEIILLNRANARFLRHVPIARQAVPA